VKQLIALVWFVLCTNMALAQDASLRFEVQRAVIGEPLAVVLTVPHARGERIKVVAEQLTPDDSWLFVEGPETLTAADGASTTVRWSVFSIDVGERAFELTGVYRGDGAPVEAAPANITIQGELLPDEDQPRPFTDFHEIEDGAVVRSWHWLVLLAALVGSSVWFFARKREATESDRGPSASEQLAELELDEAADPERTRTLTYEISRLVRSAIDHAQATDASGLTDEEWLAAQRASGKLDAQTLDQLAQLLADCESVKYAGAAPTTFAVRDNLERARRVVGSLDEEADA